MEYVTHAYAKGLSNTAVLLRHVFKNAFTPTLSLVGWLLGHCWQAPPLSKPCSRCRGLAACWSIRSMRATIRSFRRSHCSLPVSTSPSIS